MENIITYQIHENPLTTDVVEKCKEGYHFKGHNGAKYRVIYYTYANEWSDRENVIYGKTLDAVLKKYDKATGRLQDIQEIDTDYHPTTEELAREIEYEC